MKDTINIYIYNILVLREFQLLNFTIDKGIDLNVLLRLGDKYYLTNPMKSCMAEFYDIVKRKTT